MAAPKGAARSRRATNQRAVREAPDRQNRRPLNPRATEDARRAFGGNGDPRPALNERHRYTCPVCGDGNADATWKVTRYGYADWLIGCQSLRCRALGGDYLKALAVKVGARDGAALKDDPRPYLRQMPSARRAVAAGKAPELPSAGVFGGRSARLLASERPLAYLTDERRIGLEEIRQHEIGWDGERLMFPMRHAGVIVAAKTRFARRGAQMIALPGLGRPWPLYPEPELEWSWALAVAGELDALRGRSAGLPACSVTLGAGTWRDDWTEALRPFRVAVLFDNNEQAQGHAVVRRLRAAGVSARRLDLRTLGLRSGKGDLSDYLNGGGDPVAIRRAALRKKQ